MNVEATYNILDLCFRKTKAGKYHEGLNVFLFTRREGYPNKLVNPSWRGKDNPGLQAKFSQVG